MTTPKTKPEFKDESAVRALYQRLLETWEIGSDAGFTKFGTLISVCRGH